MTKLREMLAWALYGAAHSVWWTFDRTWCGGMAWPVYRAYNSLMGWSVDIQAGGNGPWEAA